MAKRKNRESRPRNRGPNRTGQQKEGSRPRRKRYVAFHEGGHAVAADWYGVGFSVTIDDESRLDLESTCVEIACQVVYAGPLAQTKYQRQGLVTALLKGGASDMAYIESQLGQWADIGAKDSKRSSWKNGAQWILDKRWDLVTAVAERLIERGTLSSVEVREIACSLGHNMQDLEFVPD